jgi:hypothetical protein
VPTFLVLLGFGDQMMAEHFAHGLGIADNDHTGREPRDIDAQFSVLFTANLASERGQDSIGWSHDPCTERLILRHKHKLHQKIVIVLVKLLTGKTDFQALDCR